MTKELLIYIYIYQWQKESNLGGKNKKKKKSCANYILIFNSKLKENLGNVVWEEVKGGISTKQFLPETFISHATKVEIKIPWEAKISRIIACDWI